MQTLIESIWEDRNLLQKTENQDAIKSVIEQLDKGIIRVAEPTADG